MLIAVEILLGNLIIWNFNVKLLDQRVEWFASETAEQGALGLISRLV